MKMLVLSQQDAVEMSEFLDKKTSIISIVAPGERKVKFYDNPNIDKIFRMRFSDLLKDIKTEKKTYYAPKQKDFVGLKEFVDNLDCKLLIVHCAAGHSRSAGVAAAINEYLNLGYTFFNDPSYCPNLTVYNCCLKEFNVKERKYL